MPDQSQQNPNIQPPYHFEEDTISLVDIVLVLARQLKVIIITPIILCAITIIYVLFFAKPVYDSTAKIMSLSGRGGSTQASGIAAQFGINLPSRKDAEQWVYPEIIKSRTLARAMMKRKFDTEKYGPQNLLLQILTYGDGEPNYGIDTLEILAINSFIEMIKFSEDSKTGVSTVTLSGPEPQFVAKLTETLIEELDSHQREYNKAKTSETKIFIEERIASTRFELEAAEETLKDFTDRNRRIENSPALQLERERLYREVKVLTGVFTTLKQQLETTKIEELKESDYVFVLDPPEAPLYATKPKKKMLVTVAGFLGIGLGIVFGLLREYVQSSDEEDWEKMIKAKSLVWENVSGLIPGKSKN